MTLIRVLALSCLMAGVAQSQEPVPTTPDSDVLKELSYFPVGTLDVSSSLLDRSQSRRFSLVLAAMQQLPLQNQKDGAGFRFLWMRTSRHPISVHITKGVSGIRIDAFEVDGLTGFTPPGKMLRRMQRSLTQREWAKVSRLCNLADLQALSKRNASCAYDGAQWVMEAYGPEQYCVVNQCSPDKGSYRQLGLYFLGLPGWKFRRDELF